MSATDDNTLMDGSELPLLAETHHGKRCRDEDHIRVTLHLRHGRPMALFDDLHASMPHRRRCLTPEEFEEQYGASEEDIELVKDFAKKHRWKIKKIDRAACLVVLEGSARSFGTTFGVELKDQKDASGSFRGYQGKVRISPELKEIVLNVTGLETRSRLARHRSPICPVTFDAPLAPSQAKRRARAIGRSVKLEAAQRDVSLAPRVSPPGIGPSDAAALTDESVPTPSLFPRQVAELYNFPKDLDGTGQTIGIFAYQGGYFPDDLKMFCDAQNIPVPEIITVPAGSNKPDTTRYSMEVSADVQVAGTVAPGARIVLYFCKSEDYFLNALKQAMTDKVNRPSVFSISYGSAEEKFERSDAELLNSTFADAAQMGITICVASGDGGSASHEFLEFPEPVPHVSFPASCPFVLACGGTSLKLADGKIKNETTWNYLRQCIASSGGGISTVFPEPHYQSGLNIAPNATPGVRFKGRGVPDVAGHADLNPGYKLMFNGQMMPGMAGTSFVAPLWAALIARLNQGLGYRCGHINPVLYKLANEGVFVDITEGSNGAYHAGPGWDPCTGLGRPDGTKLLAAMKALEKEPGVQKPIAPDPLATPAHAAAAAVFAAAVSAASAATAAASAFRSAALAARTRR